MGAVLGLLGSDGVDEYMSCEDTCSDMVDIAAEETHPRTFRLRGLPTELLASTEGTAAGRVAHALIAFSAARLGLELDVSPPDACCIHTGISSVIEQIHQGIDTQGLKIPKDARSVCWCISRGYPVAVCVPVTIDVTEKRFDPPVADDAMFAMVPIVLWGYSTVTQKFAVHVPMQVYDQGTVVPFSHVFHNDSCDFYIADVQIEKSVSAATYGSDEEMEDDLEDDTEGPSGDQGEVLFLR